MNKFSEIIMKQNFKKIGSKFLLITLITFVTALGGLYLNFNSRIGTWRTQIEVIHNVEHKQNEVGMFKEENGSFKNKDLNHNERFNNKSKIKRERKYLEYENILEITTKDKILVGLTMLAGTLLFAAYWMIVTLWVVQSALRIGTNPLIWGFLVLFFNLGAVVVFYVFVSLKTKCPSCGKIHKKGEKYCSSCGAQITKTCSNCGNEVKSDENYCNKCGKNIDE